MKNLFFSFFLFSLFSFGQVDLSSSNPKQDVTSIPPSLPSENLRVFDTVDQEAIFTGKSGIYTFLVSNVLYPQQAIGNKTEGKVTVKFIVEKDGSISDIKVIGKRLGDGLDEEAIRVVSLTSGMWAPAIKNEIVVRSYFRVPVMFRLPPEDKTPSSQPKQEEKYVTIDATNNPPPPPPIPSGQNKSEEVYEIGRFTGKDGLTAYNANNLEYPQQAIDNKIEGTIIVKFAVEPDGSVSNVKIVGNKLGYGLDEEAITAIEKTSGSWKPIEINGQAVRSYYRVPITFKLPPKPKVRKTKK